MTKPPKHFPAHVKFNGQFISPKVWEEVKDMELMEAISHIYGKDFLELELSFKAVPMNKSPDLHKAWEELLSKIDTKCEQGLDYTDDLKKLQELEKEIDFFNTIVEDPIK